MASIPDSNPFINVTNWPAHEAEGWRWARNLAEPKKTNKHSSETVIETYQRDFGAARVTLGNAWNDQTFSPAGESGMIGIYVRDAETQVAALMKDLELIESGDKEL